MEVAVPFRLPAAEILSAAAPPAGRRIGRSREGRALFGHRLGEGVLRLSLIAGCHADEPVGPRLLEHLAGWLASPRSAEARAAATFFLVPHVNPDGEERNRAWTTATVPVVDHQGGPDEGYDLGCYLGKVRRELPGDDVEFGFPRHPEEDDEARPENRAVATFLAAGAPFHLHATLHGMAFARGPWFLLEPAWVERTAGLRESLSQRVAAMGYLLHDVDRHGEKGFHRISEGFCTRPDSNAMAEHFRARGDEATATQFRPSSMEHVRSLGGDPLTLVSEMPLFLADRPAPAGRPDLVDPNGKVELHRWLIETSRQGGECGLRPMPVRDQMRLQLAMLEAGIGELQRSAR